LRTAARAGIGHRGGDSVAGTADAIIAAHVGGLDLPTAVRAVALAVHEAVGEGNDDVGVGVHRAARAGDAVLLVDGALAGVAGREVKLVGGDDI
jgi:hypothetical protein